MSRVKLLLIAMGLLVLLWGGYFLFFSASPKDVVTQQLEAMKVGDINKAYASMSQEYQKTTPLTVFQGIYGNIFVNFRSLTFSGEINDDNALFVSVETANGFVEDLEYIMIKEGLAWKISSMELLTKASEADHEEINLESQ